MHACNQLPLKAPPPKGGLPGAIVGSLLTDYYSSFQGEHERNEKHANANSIVVLEELSGNEENL